MWKVLGSLGATLAVALVIATAAVAAGAMHSGSKGCAIKESCATGGLNVAAASTPDAASEAAATEVHDAGDHLGMSLDPDGLEGVLLPLNGAGSLSLAKVRTSDAPEFGFDVSL